jgi:putative hemolysin
MNQITLELTIIFFLILGNGVLAMSEIAVVSARKARLQQLAEAGDDRARAALKLANDPSRFLSTVQIGITLVGILAGTFGGATLAGELAALIARVPVLEAYSSALGVALVVLGITFLSLVVGELAPKQIGLSNPERVASLVARPMTLLSRLASPAVSLLSVSTGTVLRMIGVKQAAENPISEEEIRIMLDEGAAAGEFERVESEMVDRIFRLGDRVAASLMTPRREVIYLNMNATPDEIRRKLAGSGHSRLPVADAEEAGGLDNVQGVVVAKELLVQELQEHSLSVTDLMHAPLFVPETMPALDVLERFRRTRSKLALVIDEFGVFQGVVTLNDILESIVGDLPDRGKPIRPEAVLRADGSWLIDGSMPVDEFKELLDIKVLPSEDERLFQTVGGFVVTVLGHIPRTGESFEWASWQAEVLDMDGLRVDKVLIAQQSQVEEA